MNYFYDFNDFYFILIILHLFFTAFHDSMPKSPKFTVDDGEDDTDLHEDIRQLFHESSPNQQEVNIPSSKYIAHALREK